MKLPLLSLALMASMGLHAQTTALDFTAADCAGTEHHLFAELDSGYCVVIDLVMMNCPGCGPATLALHNDVLPNVSDPSRVKFYSIGYTNSITCAQILDWRNALPLDHTVFAGMSSLTAYYGGMGMPTVVVLGGGTTHGVYYNHMGYNANQASPVIDAINAALADAVGIGESLAQPVVLGPNPATHTLHMEGGYTAVRVFDMQGRMVLQAPVHGETMDVSGLVPGTYQMELSKPDGSRALGRFVKE
jgi:hypothetical protein